MIDAGNRNEWPRGLGEEAVLEKCFSCDLLKSISICNYSMVNGKTYRPSASDPCYYPTRYHHRPQPPRTLEKHPAQPPRKHTIRRIMFAPIISYRRIDTIVHHRNHARRVPQERPPPRHRVQDTIQPQFRRRGCRRSVQPFNQTPRASGRQGRQVCHAGAVAEVVGPAARGEGGAGAGQVGEGRFVEREVVQGFLV